MKRISVILLVFFAGLTLKVYSQATNGKVFSSSGKLVVTQKSNVQNDSLTIQFFSPDGSKYYLLSDKAKQATFDKLVKHPDESVKVSGTLVDRAGKQYIIVESFIFL